MATRTRRLSVVNLIGFAVLIAIVTGAVVVAYSVVGSNGPARKSQAAAVAALRESWGGASGPASASPSATPGGATPPGAEASGGTPSGTVTPGASGSSTPAVAPAEGTPVAILRIPRFGADYEVPILVGTSTSTLRRGVGWYAGTTPPGQVGNFAVAGLRTGWGQPFADLLTLRQGDEVIVETEQAIYTYVIDTAPADLTVDRGDTSVLAPIPGGADVPPVQAAITLTTSQDRVWTSERSVGIGLLASAMPR